ncbi:AbgT family transporter [Ornithinicoccus halotolerans]|uniref:AbgT family transporter n=1 Tax=Ornithinicoccus halotolerans TaxID=1748220 RepID=UPI001297AD0F|nr:AbgT family transporter [Ornithinicoccus halotolerans]
MTATQESARSSGLMFRMLDMIERAGNRIPHPFWLFLILGGIVLVLSLVLSLLDVSVASPNENETIAVVNLLSVDGIRRIVTEAISNFTGFPPLGIVLVVMMGVAVAEGSGLISTAVRSVVTSVSGRWLTFAVAITGVSGSVASDAVVVVLPPLAALAYLAVGRSPLFGIAVGFASVDAGFNASLFITAGEPLYAGISTSAAQILDEDYVVSPLANIYFTIPSAVFLAALITLVMERYVAPRVERIELDGPYAPGATTDDAEEASEGGEFEDLESMRLSAAEKRGLRNAALALVAFLAAIAALVAIPGSPLRGEEGGILTGPVLLHVSVLIALMFVALGVAYGVTVGTISSWTQLPEFMVNGMKDIAPVLVLFFAAAQFIAWFEWSNIGTILAVSGADLIESMGLATVVLFIVVIVMTYLLNLFITSGSAQWTLMAPVIVPAMMLLGVSPEVSQMLFRIGDSASNLITPLNVYFALMLTYLQRYRRDAGIGTLLSMTLPVSIAVFFGWTAFFLLWYALGIPIGPGAPVR